MTQLTLNIKISNTIKITSFFVNYERESNLFDYKKSLILTNATKSRIKILKRMHENIMKMQSKSSKYINNKCKNAPLLKKKNKIYFFIKNFKKKDKNKKLNLIKVKIFLVKKIKKFKNYKLNLSKNVKIHLVFNISLLKLIDLNIFIQEIFHYEK